LNPLRARCSRWLNRLKGVLERQSRGAFTFALLSVPVRATGQPSNNLSACHTLLLYIAHIVKKQEGSLTLQVGTCFSRSCVSNRYQNQYRSRDHLVSSLWTPIGPRLPDSHGSYRRNRRGHRITYCTRGCPRVQGFRRQAPIRRPQVGLMAIINRAGNERMDSAR